MSTANVVALTSTSTFILLTFRARDIQMNPLAKEKAKGTGTKTASPLEKAVKATMCQILARERDTITPAIPEREKGHIQKEKARVILQILIARVVRARAKERGRARL